jgi:hypothetical protein
VCPSAMTKEGEKNFRYIILHVSTDTVEIQVLQSLWK